MYSLGLGGQSGLYNSIVMKKHLFFCISAIFCIVLCMAAKPEERTKPVQEVQSKRDAAVTTNPSFPMNDNAWYDVNRDGIMDFVNNNRIYLSSGKGYEEIHPYEMIGASAMMSGPDGEVLYYGSEHVGVIDHNKMTATPVFTGVTTNDVLYPVDVNGNGQLSLLKLPNTKEGSDKKRYYTYKGNGQGYESKFESMTVDDYLKNYYHPQQSSMFSSLSAGAMWSQMYYQTPKVEATSGDVIETHDINNDGLPDLVDHIHQKIMYNVGNGRYATVDFGGQILLRDFNGDGVEDYIIYDEDAKRITSYIRNSDGTQTEKVIINGYYCGKQIWAHDLDNDGDIDLVLPLSSTPSDGHSPRTEFIIIMENKGNGTFKRHENAVGNTYLAYDCKDVDNDGCYEVLAYNRQSGNETAIYKIDKLQLSPSPTVISGKSQYVAIHDLNTSKWILNSGKEIEGNTNTLPSAPGKPTIFYDASSRMLKVQWTPGKDKETPTADLTYSLRAGTSVGAEDVVWADAMPDGRRLNLTGGNMGHSLKRVFDVSSWPEGDIHISVQAVDGSHGGSPFSEEVVFTKREPACDFNVEYSKPFTLHDECVVSLTSAPVDGYEYLWDFDGAEVVEADADAQCYRLKYATPGNKVISLAVKGGENGAEARRDYAVEVCPLAVKWEGKLYYAYYDPFFALDLDEDGVYELFDGKFKKAEGDTYSEISKMYNSHSEIRSFSNGTLTDLNHDGHVDLYQWTGSGDGYTLDPNVNSLMAINEEDLNLEISDEGSDHYHIPPSLYYDLDNDGNVDLVADYGRENMIFRNLGGMPPKFDKISLTNSPEWWIDVDKDGLLDFVAQSYSYEDNARSYNVYYNQGDFTFSKGEAIKYDSYYSKNIDLDNNGKLDRIVCMHSNNGYIYSIMWDNGEETPLLTEFDSDRTGLDRFNYNADLDLDNNGYIDILFPEGYVVMIDKNRKITEARLEMDDLLPYSPDSRGEWFKRADGKRARVSGGNLTTVVPNEAPAAPTGVRHTQGTRFVEIEWNHSVDKETPADAMRYNVSVKRKGATGEGAYLLSPCNGEKDFGLIPTGKQLVYGNRIRIPMASIAPGEYEVRVQGVDLMFESSAFSESYAMMVKESVNMELPATTETDFETAVTILLNVDVDIDWDGATVHEQTKNRVLVSWHTPGIKTVKMGDYTASILVKEKPDASFIAPQEVHVRDRVVLAGNSLDDGTWEYRDASNSQYSWKSVNAPDAKYWIKWDTDDEGRMCVTFLDNGSYELKHTVSYGFSDAEYIHRFDVLEAQTPAIKLVSADSTTGKHTIAFDNFAIQQGVSSINVYKETDMYDVYRKIAELPIGTDSYVDLSSTPEVKGARYKLTYALPYGVSGFSRVHRPMHVMINTGVGSAWNLLWTPYEGMDVASYRILRGTSPENMIKIDEVSGSMNSYTDFTAPAGEVFYAVEIAVSADVQKKVPARSVASASIARSNVVSTSMAAGMVNFAESIQIYSISGATEIDCQSSNTLDLGVAITPMHVTISKVAWEISEGTDLATVDNYGRVTATGSGNGTVVVTAHTNDGSRLSDSFSVTIKGATSAGVNDVAEVADKFKVTVNQATHRIILNCIPVANDGTSTVTVYDISGTAHISTKTTEDYMEIDAQHLSKGIYIVYVASDAGCAHARIIVSR